MSDRICDLCTDRYYRKKAQIRSVAVQRLGTISKKENKLVNVRYLGYIIAKLQKNIPSSCWDPFTSCNVPTNSHCQIIQPYSTLSFFGIYELWSTKFFTDVKHTRDCLSWKFDGGLQQKIFRESQKSANLSEHKFGRILVLVNRSQQLLGIFLCKLAVM